MESMSLKNRALIIIAATLILALPITASAQMKATHTATELRPLDDPENPYRGQYREWDVWAYEHFRPGMDGEDIMAELPGVVPDLPKVRLASFLQLAADAEGQLHLWTYQKVDEDGFLVPAGLPGSPTPELRTFAFASGPIERETYEEWMLQVNAAAATRYPPIPAFIGENPPLQVAFVPNGEFAVKGPLGLGDTEEYDMQAASQLSARERWYRYSAEGELLGMTGVVGRGWRDQSWMLLYWPQLPQKIEEMKQQGLEAKYRGDLVAFAPSRSRSYTNEADMLWDRDRPFPENSAADIVECYDLTGNPVPAEEAWPDEPSFETSVKQLDAPILKTFYEAQLAVGYTTREPSPFAGQPNGPQLATDEYRPPVAAYPSRGGDTTFTEKLLVRELDSPGNPYAGQYSEWDRLCLESYGKVNQQEMKILNDEMRRKQRLVDEAKAEGMSLEEFKRNGPAIHYGVPTSTYRDAGVVTLFCYVDDDGYVIPMSRLHSWSGARTDGSQRTEWMISATVSMDEQQLQRFEDWKAEVAGQ